MDGFFNCVVIVPEKKCNSSLIELVNKIIINPGLIKEALCNLTEEGIVYNAPYYANTELTTNTVNILKKVNHLLTLQLKIQLPAKKNDSTAFFIWMSG